MSLAALMAVVGEAQVLHLPEDVARYNSDGRQAGGRSQAVVRPGSTAEVSALMRVAALQDLRLVPQGARTGLVGAGLAQDDVVLSLERLNATPAIDPVNRTADAEAGVLLSSLNAAADGHGLFFPIDLGADPSVGGMIAANTGGSRLLRFGDVRRNLLGLEIVLADGDGTIVRLGRGLWKDNSRLDLKQLWSGSAGALGVVTRATLALQPQPVARVTAMLALSDAGAAVDLLIALEAAFGMLLTAFEGMSQSALDAVFTHIPHVQQPFANGIPDYAVLLELAGGSAFSEEIFEEVLGAILGRWMEGTNAPVSEAVLDRRDRLWNIRHSIPEGLRAAGRVIGCDIAMKRGDVMRFREDVGRRIAAIAPQLRLCDFGHVGDGGIHFNLVWPAEAGQFDPALAERARATVFDAVVRDYGGSFSAEHGLGPVNAKHYARLVPEAERRLAGHVQQLIAPVPIGHVDFGMETCS